MIEDIVIQYRADTTDLARARKELGLVDDVQGDLLDQFKLVNAQVASQVQLLAQVAAQGNQGGIAANDQAAAIQEVAAALSAEAKAAAAASQAEAEGRREATQATRLQAAEAERARKASEQAAKEEASAVGLLGGKLKQINDLKASKLQLVDEDQLRRVNAELEELEAEYRRLDTAGTQATQNVGEKTGFLGKVLGEIGPLIAGAFAVDKLVEYAGKVVELTAQYQKSQAVLTNTLGSAKEANKALADIQTFAASTPFSVNELTESYIKLANQGFKPTTSELTKLGDLASSTGKTFDELTEAILDAQANEFERLKEFGILSSKNGDKVTFTFKEQKTTVDATASSIRKYLLGLGDLQGVSGSMAAISGTLAGQFSNLGDTTDQLFLSIGKKLAPGIASYTSQLATLLTNLTKLVQGNSEVQRSNLEVFTSANQDVVAHKALADTYENLSKKTTLNAAEKTKLKGVTQDLIAIYGESITQINAETGALGINLEALKKKIVLEQALQSEAARNLLAEKLRLETSLETARTAQDALDTLAASANNGKLTDVVGAQISRLVQAARQGSLALDQTYRIQQQGLTQSGINITEYNNRVGAILPTLGRYAGAILLQGKNQKDLTTINNQLLAQGIDLDALAQTNVAAATEEAKVLGLLGAARKRLKDELATQDNYGTEAALKASEERAKVLSAEVKRLEGLADKLTISFKFRPVFAEVSDKDLQPLIDASREAAQKAAEAARDLKLKVLDQDFAQEKIHLDRVKQYALQDLREQLSAGQITRGQYEVGRAAVEKRSQEAILLEQIAGDKKKLNVEGQTVDQRLALNQKLADDEGALEDLKAEKAVTAEQKKQDIIADLRQQGLAAGAELVNQLFANDQQVLADRLTALQAAQQAEITLAGNTADAKGKIDAAYAGKANAIRKEQNELAQKQAIFNKALAVGQIITNTAVGITRVIAEVPKFDFGISTGILIAAYTALGLLQIGSVLAQPVAKFAAGTDYVRGGRPGVDSVHALLMPGERVVTTAKNKEYTTTLTAIHRGEVPAPLLAQFVLDYKGQNARFSPTPVRYVTPPSQTASDQAFQERLLRGIAERPVQKFIFDAEGSREYQEREGGRSRSLNDKYSF